MVTTRRRATHAPAPEPDSVEAGEPNLEDERQSGNRGQAESTSEAVSESVPSGEEAPQYFMESSREGARLERKIDPYQVGMHLMAAGLRHDIRALDVACGSGAITRIMSRIAGPGRVTGIDSSASRLKEARQRARAAGCDVEFAQGVAHSLPFADGTFAFTHARMLFQYLPNPLRVLEEMKRVTEPGGTVVVIDLDGQIDGLYPMPEDLRIDLDAALQHLRTTGFDPYIGRKLFGFFHQARLERIETQVEPYQVYAGGNLTLRDRENWYEKLHTATEFLARLTGEASRWRRFRDAYLACLQAPNAFYHATVMIVRGIVPSVS